MNSYTDEKVGKISNPTRKRELRADFPQILKSAPSAITQVVQRELTKHNETIDTVGKIYIAYPHKDPRIFPDYHSECQNQTIDGVKDLILRLTQFCPNLVKWIPADSIVEQVQLKRSQTQNTIHALSTQQKYTLHEHKDEQKSKNPFDDQAAKTPPYFIVFDHYFEQGTTFANLINFIEHNGGHVLAAVSYYIARSRESQLFKNCVEP